MVDGAMVSKSMMRVRKRMTPMTWSQPIEQTGENCPLDDADGILGKSSGQEQGQGNSTNGFWSRSSGGLKSRVRGVLWARFVGVATLLFFSGFFCSQVASSVLVAMGTTVEMMPWNQTLYEASLEKDEIPIRRLHAALEKQSYTSFSLKDLMKRKSSWGIGPERTRGVADVTAILMDSPYLKEQLDMLLVARTKPAKVWVVMPAKDAAATSGIVSKYKHGKLFGDRLDTISSDLFSDQPGVGGGDSGFFNAGLARFQLAIQADTKFIWVLDPGVMPGLAFLDLLTHVATSGVVGVFGGLGALMPAAPASSWSQAGFGPLVTPFAEWEGRAGANIDAGDVDEDAALAFAGMGGIEIGGVGGANAASVMWSVDMLFSQWFVDTDLIRLVFREKWNGAYEELTLSYMLRRYAGVQSYVIPFDPTLPDYRSDVGVDSPEARKAAQRTAAAMAGASLPTHPFGARQNKNNRGGFINRPPPPLEKREGHTANRTGKEPNSREPKRRRLKSAPGAEAANGGERAKVEVIVGGEAGVGSEFERGERDRFDGERRKLEEGSYSGSNSSVDGHPLSSSNAGTAVVDKRGLAGSYTLAKNGDHPDEDRGDKAASPAYTLPSVLMSALRESGFRDQFTELAGRGGRWFWTPAQCSAEVVLLVVDGARQARLLEPLYRKFSQGTDAEVFFAVITGGKELTRLGRLSNAAVDNRTHCLNVATALGLSQSSTTIENGGVVDDTLFQPSSSSSADGDDDNDNAADDDGEKMSDVANSFNMKRTRTPNGNNNPELSAAGMLRGGRRRAAIDDRQRGLHRNNKRMLSQTIVGGAASKMVPPRRLRQIEVSAIDAAGELESAAGADAGTGAGEKKSGQRGENRWLMLERKTSEFLGLGARHGGRGRNRISTPEEFCDGDTFGVFKIRIGQDFSRGTGRPMDPFLDVYHSLTELLTHVEPMMVAYISPDNGESHGIAGSTAALTRGGGVGDNVVVAAVEAAVRSTGAARHPVALPLPATVDGAKAAKEIAYLPKGCMEQWGQPRIVLALVHPREAAAEMLSRTLRALQHAHYVGDSVELRLALHGSAIDDKEVQELLSKLKWTAGPLVVSYFYDAPGGMIATQHIAALEAFSDAGVHNHVIPLFSGALPSLEFYVQLKVALINEGYAPKPFIGQPLTQSERNGFRLVQKRPDTDEDASSGSDNLTRPSIAGEFVKPSSTEGTDKKDEMTEEAWGSSLSLSVHSPEGMCASPSAECSRVWMYGSVAWSALRNRCRLAVVGGAVVAGETNPDVEAVDVGCAVGIGATAGEERGGGVLLQKHVCGVWPPGAQRWSITQRRPEVPPRVVVWEVEDGMRMAVR